MPDLQYDAAFDIALGRSRNETKWTNKNMLWSNFVERLKKTHVTAETHAEYMASKKERQDEIKDVGGFVGGYLSGGRRLSRNVLSRQLVTLDIDFGKVDFWEDFEMTYGNAAVLYSTHKHSSQSPRYRLIMLLDRAVRPDEYEAICRRIAGNLGIEAFDPTTFQPERLMFWPSTSKGSEYVFCFQDGPLLNADDVLASYRDYTDTSAWPVSSRVNKILRRSMIKQGEPGEKPGILGAFCRTYTISEAIEAYLSDVYEACDMPDRYTFKEGSTAGGLVVYEDKFAFSHHGTDPTSGRLCNAFDLVRIHKFGLKDEDVPENTSINNLPSYSAMTELSAKDAKVRVLLVNTKLEEARHDFAGLEAAEEETEVPANDDWKKKLDVDRKGNFFSTINNMVLIMENDPVFRNNIAFDDFEKREVLRRNLPWRKITYAARYLTNKDVDCVKHYLETVYTISNASNLSTALSVISERTKFHPIRDYLNANEWDGVPRVDKLFVDYMGATDTPYTRAVTRKILCAAIARVFTPGCKFDYMLVFNGPQGLGKSSLIGRLGGDWFSESFNTVHGKEAIEQVQGVWLGEIAELAGLRNADIETVKQYVSRRVDRYRAAYDERVENFPRQCVFFGSTNKKDFLKDRTGNRRFWPVDTGTPSKDVHTLSTDEVAQIWAEAMTLYTIGEPLYLSKELEVAAKRVQDDHAENDERIGIILEYLDKPLPKNWYGMSIYDKRAFLHGEGFEYEGETVPRERVCAAEIYCEVLGGVQKDMSAHNTRFIHEVMRAVPGWIEYESRTTFKGYGNQKGYYKDRRTVTTVRYAKTEKTTVETLADRKHLN